MSGAQHLSDHLRSLQEFEADYFGVQYLYKAGYDPDCYIRFVERVWPAPAKSPGVSDFPAASERVKALHNEVADILPLRRQPARSTSAFERFEQRLHTWRTPASRTASAIPSASGHSPMMLL